MEGVVVNSGIYELKDTFGFSTALVQHPLLVIDFTSPKTEVMSMSNALALLPGEPWCKEVSFARVYGGLPEVLMAARVLDEPTYQFYFNGTLHDEWAMYGRAVTGTSQENADELERRVRALVEAAEGSPIEEGVEGEEEEDCEATGLSITDAQMQVFKKDFDMVDVDGSGAVDTKEIGFLLKLQLGRKPAPCEVDAVLKAFDTDQNGSIDFSEYMQWMLGEGWSVVKEDDDFVPAYWQFKSGARKTGRAVLTVFADRMMVYQRDHPWKKGEVPTADRRIGFVKEDSRIALVPKWTHIASRIDANIDMRASSKELGAQAIEFKLESSEDLLRLQKPQSVCLVDFVTGQNVKLKGTRKGFTAVCKYMLKTRK
eukprot:TRINITY_DN27759_c0_g2_i1.p1 TRINITY_DN27759_c0_g2~~TRINITY_DN27759_c0_g2_i1.p1  ORF type:complete len:370 (+),score=111.64 TRINITY_DN27759_c0_g2_i1:167-1276(+)